MIAVTPVPPRVVVVGRGRLGRAISAALVLAGRPPAVVSGTSASAAPLLPFSELAKAGPGAVLVLAVRDDALEGLARVLAGVPAEVPSGAVVLHLSGALGPRVLEPLATRGFATGCCHPLQTFPGTAADAGRFSGVTFGIDGDAGGLAAAVLLSRSLGGRPVQVPMSARSLYHLAASLGANGLTGLVAASRDALVEAGFTPPEALAALGPLLRSALEEALRLGPEDSLTGPVARGDDATLESHRRTVLAWDASRAALFEALLREQRRLAMRGRAGAGC
jgi:predicted short-subunit dehydrogenase-like oxidoreductase (DUF2520 family)